MLKKFDSINLIIKHAYFIYDLISVTNSKRVLISLHIHANKVIGMSVSTIHYPDINMKGLSFPLS